MPSSVHPVSDRCPDCAADAACLVHELTACATHRCNVDGLPRGCGVGWPELRALPSWPRMHRISAARSCVPDGCGAVVRTVSSRRPEPGRPLTEPQYYGAGQHGGPVAGWVLPVAGGCVAAHEAAS